MPRNWKDRILLALDGSDRAFETVKYVSKIIPFQKMQSVLFTVYDKIPESFWDLERQPLYGPRLQNIRAWEMNREKTIREYMNKAKQYLLASGFSDEAVTVRIQEREKGIARDIIKEAENGYAAVVVGRKGTSKVKNLVLGSVASKLVERTSFTPLLMVGRNVPSGKILIGLDPSEGSMRAVDFVARTLSDCDFCEVELVHVIRGKSDPAPGHHKLFIPKEYVEEARERIGIVFEKARDRLVKAGFDPDQVSTKVITGAHSRAAAIVAEATEGKYGTVVVGRRGLSMVQDFFIGRVSNKVLQLAKGQAVWVVS
jgi:nucleotide-binding universal stress UspA family protein